MCGVLVVADRVAAGQGQHPDLARSRGPPRRSSGVKTFTSGPSVNSAVRPVAARARDRRPHAQRLRGSEDVDQHHRRVMGQQALLDLLAPHGPRRDDPHQRRQVPAPWVGVELGHQGPGEGVAHDHQVVDRLAGHRVEDLHRVEVTPGQHHHRAALGQAARRGEQAGPVHQRAGDQADHAGPARPGSLPRRPAPRPRGSGAARRAVHAGEQVVLSPHDALGHAGGAPGVEHEQVVAAASPRWGGPATRGRRRILVGGGPGRTGTGPVVDPQPVAHPRHPVPHGVDAAAEAAVEDHRHRVGVVPQVGQLVLAVAVVGVDRDQCRLQRAEHGLEVLGAVVEVERHLVLVGHPRRQQPAGHAVRPGVEVGPAQAAVALDDGRRIGLGRGHRLPHVGEIPLRHF